MTGDSDAHLLFAYGSNLYPPRLRARAPSVRYLQPAVLPGHALRLHKRGSDGSAKADAHATQKSSDEVWGVLHTLDPIDKQMLDTIEGPGYHEVLVRVRTRAQDAREEEAVTALMYQARPAWRTLDLQPFRWYREFIVAGARHHGFPADYVRTLRSIDAVRDPDPERRRAAEHILASHGRDPQEKEPPERP